jgi:Domain of unknown function (DUF4915)
VRFKRDRIPPGFVLLASGFGYDTGGGLFAVREDGVERLDALSTTGLTLAGDRLVRLLRAPEEPGYGSELLVYDERGVVQYHRLEDVDDPHDVHWDGSSFVVVSTALNAIAWVAPSGEIIRRWTAPGDGDAWHVNSLTTADGRLLAAAFGDFTRHREWVDEDPGGRGFVFDVETREQVVGGLTCPHHPRLLDGRWVVCNSRDHELVELESGGRVSRRLVLRGWTRGIATTDRVLFVGESAARDGTATGERAAVSVVPRRRWRVADRIDLPCREIYDLLLVPEALANGVRNGFATNPLRLAEQSQRDLFTSAGVQPTRLWASAEPLPVEACRVEITAKLPDALPRGTIQRAECRVTNKGSAILISAPPNPVNVSYRWLEGPQGAPLAEGLRSPLPRPLPPEGAAECRVALEVPAIPGDYTIRVTLVQEQVRWFDEVDSANGWTKRLRVA